ncbi:histidinol dehydrogenase, partial [Tritonibacter sp. SIMBA_163]|uniref:histidinol dehydrogenase n=1 Tax=Tritonibacter sp. SIMBA_163 TaxID=3080868 RepID=UPI00397EBDDC
AWLVTHSRRVGEEALAALPDHWARMTEQRVGFSKTVLTGKYGGIVLTSSVEESYKFINDYAPEHLDLLSTDPFAHLG